MQNKGVSAILIHSSVVQCLLIDISLAEQLQRMGKTKKATNKLPSKLGRLVRIMIIVVCRV